MDRQNGRKAVILLIDDDPGDQELTRRALTEDIMQVSLQICSDGEDALDYLYQRGVYSNPEEAPKPDLILLDLNMPRMDGREVLKRLKGDESLRSIPVVILTTSKQESDILKSYDLGCNSFITKPVDLEMFMTVIRGLGNYWFELVTLPSQAYVNA